MNPWRRGAIFHRQNGRKVKILLVSHLIALTQGHSRVDLKQKLLNLTSSLLQLLSLYRDLPLFLRRITIADNLKYPPPAQIVSSPF
jgi:hypothetical protein